MNTATQLLNRRDFTKTTLLAGAALASGALTTFGADESKKRIRIGVIGCGIWSEKPIANSLAAFLVKK